MFFIHYRDPVFHLYFKRLHIATYGLTDNLEYLVSQ